MLILFDNFQLSRLHHQPEQRHQEVVPASLVVPVVPLLVGPSARLFQPALCKGTSTLECSAVSSGFLLLATMPGALLFERCSSTPPTELTPVCSSKAAARVLPLRLLPQLVRIPRPCIAFHVVPNASQTPSEHCQRRRRGLRRVRACALTPERAEWNGRGLRRLR